MQESVTEELFTRRCPMAWALTASCLSVDSEKKWLDGCDPTYICSIPNRTLKASFVLGASIKAHRQARNPGSRYYSFPWINKCTSLPKKDSQTKQSKRSFCFSFVRAEVTSSSGIWYGRMVHSYILTGCLSTPTNKSSKAQHTKEQSARRDKASTQA